MAEALGEAALALYRLIGRLATPAVRAMLAARTRAGKEDPARRHERLGRPRLARPEGPLVWLHAASVGETVSVLPLVERLLGEGLRVLLTSGTVTSARIAADRLPAGALHQFAPVDLPSCVEGFLDHWRPGAALFVESEIWPATVAATHRRGIPLVLVNARMSQRSFDRWRRLDGVPRALFRRFTTALAQAAGDGERLAALGVGSVVVTGNLKFDGLPLSRDGAQAARLARAIGDRPVWVAASTHPGEETLAVEAHRLARAHLPRLLTVIAPRHPDRGDALRHDFAEQGLVVASRSRGEWPGPQTDIHLMDTIGEMGLVYGAAPLAFVGGSIAPRGGQNPIEPARLGVAVLHGPSTQNFAEVYGDLDAAGGATVITDPESLAGAIVRLTLDPSARGTQVAAAREVVARSEGALDRTLAALAPVLAEARRRETPT